MKCVICENETRKNNKYTCSQECKKEWLRIKSNNYYHTVLKVKKPTRCCAECGKVVSIRKTYCESCAKERRAKKQREIYDVSRDQKKVKEQRAKMSAKREEMRKVWREKGLCSVCGGKKDIPSKSYCFNCREVNSKVKEQSRREEGALPSGQSQYQVKVFEIVKSLTDCEVLYNVRNQIYSPKTGYPLELDIYIPSIKLAIEVDGKLHREASYGIERLLMQQENDLFKDQLCKENGIKLIRIDTDKVDESGYGFVEKLLMEAL